jgi:hypothetical protein
MIIISISCDGGIARQTEVLQSLPGPPWPAPPLSLSRRPINLKRAATTNPRGSGINIYEALVNMALMLRDIRPAREPHVRQTVGVLRLSSFDVLHYM